MYVDITLDPVSNHSRKYNWSCIMYVDITLDPVLNHSRKYHWSYYVDITLDPVSNHSMKYYYLQSSYETCPRPTFLKTHVTNVQIRIDKRPRALPRVSDVVFCFHNNMQSVTEVVVDQRLAVAPPEHCPGPQSTEAGKGDACKGCENQAICASGKLREPDPGNRTSDNASCCSFLFPIRRERENLSNSNV